MRSVSRLPAVDPVLERRVRPGRMPWAPAIAVASQPARMTKDAIWVHCTSAAWVSELTMLAADLRARLAERVTGLPSGIRFELGDVVQAAPSAAGGAPLLAPDPELSARADELVCGRVRPGAAGTHSRGD